MKSSRSGGMNGLSPWKVNDNYGQRLMEKMGWQTGQGLGKDNQGIKTHLKLKVSRNRMGVHCSDEKLLPDHQSDFSKLLENLNDGDHKSSEASNAPITSLEERSKSVSKHIHYYKFTRGKDLSRYSLKDFEAILGKEVAKENLEALGLLNGPSKEETKQESTQNIKEPKDTNKFMKKLQSSSNSYTVKEDFSSSSLDDCSYVGELVSMEFSATDKKVVGKKKKKHVNGLYEDGSKKTHNNCDHENSGVSSKPSSVSKYHEKVNVKNKRRNIPINDANEIRNTKIGCSISTSKNTSAIEYVSCNGVDLKEKIQDVSCTNVHASDYKKMLDKEEHLDIKKRSKKKKKSIPALVYGESNCNGLESKIIDIDHENILNGEENIKKESEKNIKSSPSDGAGTYNVKHSFDFENENGVHFHEKTFDRDMCSNSKRCSKKKKVPVQNNSALYSSINYSNFVNREANDNLEENHLNRESHLNNKNVLTMKKKSVSSDCVSTYVVSNYNLDNQININPEENISEHCNKKLSKKEKKSLSNSCAVSVNGNNFDDCRDKIDTSLGENTLNGEGIDSDRSSKKKDKSSRDSCTELCEVNNFNNDTTIEDGIKNEIKKETKKLKSMSNDMQNEETTENKKKKKKKVHCGNTMPPAINNENGLNCNAMISYQENQATKILSEKSEYSQVSLGKCVGVINSHTGTTNVLITNDNKHKNDKEIPKKKLNQGISVSFDKHYNRINNTNIRDKTPSIEGNYEDMIMDKKIKKAVLSASSVCSFRSEASTEGCVSCDSNGSEGSKMFQRKKRKIKEKDMLAKEMCLCDKTESVTNEPDGREFIDETNKGLIKEEKIKKRRNGARKTDELCGSNSKIYIDLSNNANKGIYMSENIECTQSIEQDTSKNYTNDFRKLLRRQCKGETEEEKMSEFNALVDICKGFVGAKIEKIPGYGVFS